VISPYRHVTSRELIAHEGEFDIDLTPLQIGERLHDKERIIKSVTYERGFRNKLSMS